MTKKQDDNKPEFAQPRVPCKIKGCNRTFKAGSNTLRRHMNRDHDYHSKIKRGPGKAEYLSLQTKTRSGMKVFK